MKKYLPILLLFLCSTINAVDRILITVTITNTPSNSNTFVLNGDTRTWKPTATNASSQITIGASIGENATNLFNQIASTPFSSAVELGRSGTNGITLRGQSGASMVASLTGTWGYITASTQNVSATFTMISPPSGMPSATGRTNEGNGIVQGLSDYATDAISQTALSMANFAGLDSSQSMSNKTIYLSTFHGGSITNSLLQTPIVPFRTNDNGIYFYDNTGSLIPEFSIAPDGNGIPSLYAVGSSTILSIPAEFTPIPENILNAASADFRYGRFTNANSWTGTNTFAQITNTPITGSAITSSSFSGTIGTATGGSYTGGTISGGTVGGTISTLSGGVITGTGGTNLTLTNTSTKAALSIGGSMKLLRCDVSTLANGANADVDLGTCVFVKLTGTITGAASLDGVANGSDGAKYEALNYTGQTVTIANESGLEPTPANRLLTGTGSDLAIADKGEFILKYDSAQSRWIATAYSNQTGATGTVTSVGLTVPTGFSVTGSPVTGSGTMAITRTAPVTIADGGTGQSAQTAAFNALSPTTTRGDVITRDNVGNNVRLPIGTSGKVLASDGNDPSWQTITSSMIPTGSGTAGVITKWSNGTGGLADTLLSSATNGVILGDYTGNTNWVKVAPYVSASAGAANYGGTGSITSREHITTADMYRVRQNGDALRVKVYTANKTGMTGFYVTVWRKDEIAGTWSLVAKSSDLTASLTAATINSIDLSTPFRGLLKGDYVGYRVEWSGGSATQSLVASTTEPYGGTYYVDNATPSQTGYDWSAQTFSSGYAVAVELYMVSPVGVTIGDSTVSGSTDGGVVSVSFIDPSGSSHQVSKMLDSRLESGLGLTFQNMGVNGQPSSNVAARVTSDVVNLHPKLAVIKVGINDVRGDLSFTTFSNSWVYLLGQIASAGIKPVGVAMGPFTSTSAQTHSTNGTTVEMQVRDSWNLAISNFVSAAGGVFVDPNPYIGKYRAGGDAGNMWDFQDGLSEDGLHENEIGKARVARAILDALSANRVRGNLIAGNAQIGNILSFANTPGSKYIIPDRSSNPVLAGNDLWIRGGGTGPGATNKAGGTVYITPGIGSGSSGGSVILAGLTAQASGSIDQTNLNANRITIDKNGVGFGDAPGVNGVIPFQSYPLAMYGASTKIYGGSGNTVGIDVGGQVSGVMAYNAYDGHRWFASHATIGSQQEVMRLSNGKLYLDLAGVAGDGAQMLTIFDNTAESGLLLGASSSANYHLYRRASDGRLRFLGNQATFSSFNFATSVGDVLTILNGGNVGIGTTSPSSLLELSTSVGADVRFTRSSASAVSGALLGQSLYYNGSTQAAIAQGVGDGATDSGRYEIWTKATGGSITKRMTVASGGVVTFTSAPTSPGYTLTGPTTLYGGEANSLKIGNSAGVDYTLTRRDSDGALLITGNQSTFSQFVLGTTAAANALTILNGGNVGFGVDSPGDNLEISRSTGSGIRMTRSSASASAGAQLGLIDIYNGTTRAASIVVSSDGATDSGRISFWTTPTGGSLTEQMRISSSGAFTIGTGTGVAHLSSGVLSAGNVALGSEVSGTLPVANGGTAISSYSVGDLLYASGSTTLSKLADVATGNVLISGGVTTAPSWGKVTESHLTLADNTTGNVSTSAHGFAPKAPNDATKYLDGTGAYSVPSGSGISGSGTVGVIPYFSASTVLSDGYFKIGSDFMVPLTNNVTAIGSTTNRFSTINSVLGNYSGTVTMNGAVIGSGTGVAHLSSGTVSSSAVALTSEVSGTLPEANGGTGNSSYAVGDLLYASGSTTLSKLADVAVGNVLLSGGVTTAPSWGKATYQTTPDGIFVITVTGLTSTNTATTNLFTVPSGKSWFYEGIDFEYTSVSTIDSFTFELGVDGTHDAMFGTTTGGVTAAAGRYEKFFPQPSSTTYPVVTSGQVVNMTIITPSVTFVETFNVHLKGYLR